MSDLMYFQGLYATALDFTMKAFWGARVAALNGGHVGACRLTRTAVQWERSRYIEYSWDRCEDCKAEMNHRTRHV